MSETKKAYVPNPRAMIPNMRVAFHDLWTPYVYNEKSVPSYGVTLIVEPGSDQDKLIRETMEKAAFNAWGDKAAPLLKKAMSMGSKGVHYTSENGEGIAYPDGNWRLKASRAEKLGRPAVLNRDKSPLIESDGKPYPGCYVDIEVEFFAMDKSGPQVWCRLIQVRFRNDGEAFSKRVREEPNPDVFEDLETVDDLM